MASKKRGVSKTFVTEPCRLAFASLLKATPKHATTPDKLAFQATILIPPKMSLEPFKAAMKEASLAMWNEVRKLTGREMPLKRADPAKKWRGFDEGWFFVKTQSQNAPAVVDQNRQPILDASKIYAGCWCRFAVNVFAWDNASGAGLSFGLEAVQLIREDERLDSSRKPVDELFDAVDTGDDGAPFAAGGEDFDDIMG